MTKDECLAAISEIFKVRTSASPGYWNIMIETAPVLEVILMPAFVRLNIEGGGMSKEQLGAHINSLANRWISDEAGLVLIVR